MLALGILAFFLAGWTKLKKAKQEKAKIGVLNDPFNPHTSMRDLLNPGM